MTTISQAARDAADRGHKWQRDVNSDGSCADVWPHVIQEFVDSETASLRQQLEEAKAETESVRLCGNEISRKLISERDVALARLAEVELERDAFQERLTSEWAIALERDEAIKELNEYKAADSIRTEREFAQRDLLTEAAFVILLARKALMANENTREGSEALNRGSIATSKFIASHPEFYP